MTTLVQHSSREVLGDSASCGSSQNVDKVVQSVTNATKRLSQISTHTNNSNKLKSQNRVGPWKLGRTLGRGSTGRVRLAKNVETGKYAAVKIVPKSNFHKLENPKYQRNASTSSGKRRLPYGIEREIVIMKLISHPNIMGLYDVWESKNDLYLILEYIEGGELFDYLIKHGRLKEEEAIFYFKQIIQGINYLHQFNICHRDLKPENLLLDFNKRIKIADFGMAALEVNEKLLETSCGSPHYASPEIVAGKSYHGAPSDIWSCGIILFALLTGHLPFDDENIRKLLMKVQNGKFLMPTNLSTEAKDLISKMLRVKPNERITIDKILSHPLLRKYSSPELEDTVELGFKSVSLEPLSSVSHIDKGILKSLRILFHNCSEQTIISKLVSPEKCPEKTFYYLLSKYRKQHSTGNNYVDYTDISTSESRQTFPRSVSIAKAISTDPANSSALTAKKQQASSSSLSRKLTSESNKTGEVLGNITNKVSSFKASTSSNKKKCLYNSSNISRASTKSFKRLPSQQKSLQMSRKLTGLGDLNVLLDEPKAKEFEEENRRKLTGTFGNISLLNFESLIQEVFDKEQPTSNSNTKEGRGSEAEASYKDPAVSKLKALEMELASKVHKNNDVFNDDLRRKERDSNHLYEAKHSIQRRQNSKQTIYVSKNDGSPDVEASFFSKRYFTEPASLDPRMKVIPTRNRSLGPPSIRDEEFSNRKLESSNKVLRSLGVKVNSLSKENRRSSLKKTSSSRSLSGIVSKATEGTPNELPTNANVSKEQKGSHEDKSNFKSSPLIKPPRSMIPDAPTSTPSPNINKYTSNLSNIDESTIQKDPPSVPSKDVKLSNLGIADITVGTIRTKADSLIPNPRFSRFSLTGLLANEMENIDKEILRSINTNGTVWRKSKGQKQEDITLPEFSEGNAIGLGIDVNQHDVTESTQADSNMISFSSGSSLKSESKILNTSDFGVIDFDRKMSTQSKATNEVTSRSDIIGHGSVTHSDSTLKESLNHTRANSTFDQNKSSIYSESTEEEIKLQESIKSLYKDYTTYYKKGQYDNSSKQKDPHNDLHPIPKTSNPSTVEGAVSLLDSAPADSLTKENTSSLNADRSAKKTHNLIIDEELKSTVENHPTKSTGEDNEENETKNIAPLKLYNSLGSETHKRKSVLSSKELPENEANLEESHVLENPEPVSPKEVVNVRESIMRKFSIKPKRDAPKAPISAEDEPDFSKGHKRFSRFSVTSKIYPKLRLDEPKAKHKTTWFSKILKTFSSGKRDKNISTNPLSQEIPVLDSKSYSALDSTLTYDQMLRVLKNTLDLKKMEGTLTDFSFDTESGIAKGEVPSKFAGGRKLKFKLEISREEGGSSVHITKLKGAHKSFKIFIDVVEFRIKSEENNNLNT